MYEHSDVEVPESCSCFAKACKVLIFTMTVELVMLALVTVVVWSMVEVADEGPYTQPFSAQDQQLRDSEFVETGLHKKNLSVCVYILLTMGVVGLVVVGVWLCWVYVAQVLQHVGGFLYTDWCGRRSEYEEI